MTDSPGDTAQPTTPATSPARVLPARMIVPPAGSSRLSVDDDDTQHIPVVRNPPPAPEIPASHGRPSTAERAEGEPAPLSTPPLVPRLPPAAQRPTERTPSSRQDQAMTPPRRGPRIVVAGTAGGVGTTTIAALMAAVMTARLGRPPRIVDHSGGNLIERVSGSVPNSEHWICDLGPRAISGADRLTGAFGYAIIVSSPDIENSDAALGVLQSLTAMQHKSPEAGRNIPQGVLVVNSPSHHRPPAATTARLLRSSPGAPITALPWDPALAAPGPVDIANLAGTTIQTLSYLIWAFAL